MRSPSLNHTYRLLWNNSLNAFVPVAENTKRHCKNSGNSRAIVLSLGLTLASGTFAADLPTNGQVVIGSGSISQSGNTLTVTQSTAKLGVNWQSFSIGHGNAVNFVQPSASAVALNRVTGSDVSVIQGSLTSNGQVFLVNPNGVLFSPTAQVNVGGLVATTLNLSNEDFLAGNYKFSGSSLNSVFNQGSITANNDGTIALIAAKVTNEGNLTANGGNVLIGAGSQVTLDTGGPVKLQVEQSAIDALIQNGGAIKADGGTILLTAKSAGDLASTVIKNTGTIEAQTLATGEKGEIYLLGDMANDRLELAGKIDASAPNGGDGGFIDTSAAHVDLSDSLLVTTSATDGLTGTWLIDPATWTVAASGGDETAAMLAARLGLSNINIQADNAIYINQATSWSANKLTLTSGGNIFINANLNATGTASLAFEYGQSTANGSGSTYTVANGAKIYVPNGDAFTWKKGSAGPTTNLVFDNGNLRFGDGTEASINADGQLKQPFYFDDVTAGRNGWYKLTFSNYPLDIAVGTAGDGTNSWNANGEVLSTNSGNYTSSITTKSLEISGYKEGMGTIVSTTTLTFPSSSQALKVENIYRLAAGAQYLKTDTTLTNLSGSALSNVRLWVGTRDDYVALSDNNFKIKGNLTADGFVPIATQDEQSKAVKIAEGNGSNGAAVLFYSTTSGADTVTASCCSFQNVTHKDPRTSQLTIQNDGSYALFMRMADLGAGASDNMTWYYAAAPLAEIDAVIDTVVQSATPTPIPTQTPTPTSAPTGETPAIESVQALTNQTVTQASGSSSTGLSSLQAQSEETGTQNSVGGLEIVELSQGSSGENSEGDTVSSDTWLEAEKQTDQLATLKLFVVDGGIRRNNEKEENQE